MSFFRRSNPDDLDRMRAEIIRISDTVSRTERRIDARADGGADPGPVADVDSTVDIAELAQRVDALTEQFATLDRRITAVASELANQLAELGTDIDSLQQRDPATPLPDGAIDELRDSQTRLANEQARYQIAFREDLARLAEQFRRPGTERR